MQEGTGSGDIAQKVGGGERETASILCTLRHGNVCPQYGGGWMDTATDARVRLLLRIRQLLSKTPGTSTGEGGLGSPRRLAATRLAMAVVFIICQETGEKKAAARRGGCFRCSATKGKGEGRCRRRRKQASKCRSGSKSRSRSRRVGSAVRRSTYSTDRVCPPR